MSNLKAEVVTEFGGDDRLFKLTVEGVLELEEKCSAPVATIFSRLVGSTFALNDVLHTLRLGLIGGGTPPADASKLVRRYAYPERPIAESAALARIVLGAAFVGFEQEPITAGKAKAAAESL